MSRASDAARAEKLRARLADAQATADSLRAALTRLEGRLAGEPPEATGLDLLWSAAPPMARTRSSKHQCRVAWHRIPAAQRPLVTAVVAALRLWCRCAEWRKDDGQYIPALHRWLRDRRWESIPEDVSAQPASRYRAAPKPIPVPNPEDLATPEDIAALARTLTQTITKPTP